MGEQSNFESQENDLEHKVNDVEFTENGPKHEMSGLKNHESEFEHQPNGLEFTENGFDYHQNGFDYLEDGFEIEDNDIDHYDTEYDFDVNRSHCQEVRALILVLYFLTNIKKDIISTISIKNCSFGSNTKFTVSVFVNYLHKKHLSVLSSVKCKVDC